MPRTGKGGISAQINHTNSYKITVPVLERYICTTQKSHHNDALGTRIVVPMERYDRLVGCRHIVGEASGEVSRLVACRATRQREKAEKYDVFRGREPRGFLKNGGYDEAGLRTKLPIPRSHRFFGSFRMPSSGTCHFEVSEKSVRIGGSFGFARARSLKEACDRFP
jgi:hypothetical protein